MIIANVYFLELVLKKMPLKKHCLWAVNLNKNNAKDILSILFKYWGQL